MRRTQLMQAHAWQGNMHVYTFKMPYMLLKYNTQAQKTICSICMYAFSSVADIGRGLGGLDMQMNAFLVIKTC